MSQIKRSAALWAVASLAFSILACTVNNAPVVVYASTPARVLAVVAGTALGTICALIGDAIRRFARPDAIFTTGGMGSLIWAKLFWTAGPQLIGMVGGTALGIVLVLR